MRKLILEEWISLDGYAEDKNGKLDFFPSTESNKFSDEDQLKFLEGIDTILLGRKTYELFIDFWPTATTDKEIIADRLNSLPKLVFSNSLQKAPWGNDGKWADAQIVKGDAAEELRKLKAQAGKDMVLWGSISLARHLMKSGLIDEYHIQICPTATGGGKLLFPEMEEYMGLKLKETKTYEASGVVMLKYVKG